MLQVIKLIKKYVYYGYLYGIVGVLMFFGISCNSASQQVNNAPPQRSFYYWQSVFEVDSFLEKKINDLKISTLHIKFFDVDLNPQTQQPEPVAPIIFNMPLPKAITEYIPTVFITNQTLQKNANAQDLAQKIYQKIHALARQYNLPPPLQIEIDCDWTQTTQKTYFELLTHLKKMCETKKQFLSVTLRLHQLKYKKQTGVPYPAHTATLMLYNMGKIKDFETPNSIFDYQTAMQYLNKEAITNYPLPLSIALPAFSWGVEFQNQQFKKIINNLTINALKNDTNFVYLQPYTYITKHNTTLQNHFLPKNTAIRIEQPTPAEIIKLSNYLALNLNKKLENKSPTYISFYHLNTNAFQLYETAQQPHFFETIYQIFE